jgi:membrane protein YqaA with SNARE-associated domain
LRLTRHWRAFFWSLVAAAIGGALIVILAPEFAGLFLLALYNIPSNSVFPIPHEPVVLYFAKFYHPLWVALAATIGTVVVSFADYALVEAAMRHPRIGGARERGLFKWAIRWMQRFPFWIIVLFSFTPLPISVVRILAPAAKYPVGRYIAAIVVGRFPRFLALAWIGHTFAIPTWVLIALLVLMFGSMWLASRGSSSVGLADDEEPEDAEELAIPDLSDPV